MPAHGHRTASSKVLDECCTFDMQDSDAKRARAERKERAELKLQASKQADIEQLVRSTDAQMRLH